MGSNSKLTTGPTVGQHMVGSVQRIVRAKGFGFIRGTDDRDYFFHYTELQNAELSQLVDGDLVEFIGVETPKGLRANEVTVTDSPAR